MLPVAWRRCIHLIAELGLTSNHSAASRRDAPDSTAFTTRSRNSKEHGFGIDPPSTTRINATRFNHARLSGNPDSTQPKFALGRLMAFNRMDGAYVTANRFSIGKAVVSAGTGLPSGEVAGIVDHPETDTAVAEGVTAARIRGGLPILRGDEIEGGCGVDGAPSHEQDEECAHAGIASLQR